MRKEYPLHELRRIENGWDIDLIWCPSQIYKTFMINGKEIEIYLRWRWDDPWEVYIENRWNYISLKKDYIAEQYQELMNFIDNNIEEIIKEYEGK